MAALLYFRGLKHELAAIPAQQNVASTSIAAYKDRMFRYALLAVLLFLLLVNGFEFKLMSISPVFF
jgi:hypothetical protein